MTSLSSPILVSPPHSVPATPPADDMQKFKLMFEEYVETNFGRGTRSQTVTRETYDAHRRVLAEDSNNSRRRNRLFEQGYRLGVANMPEISQEELGSGVETVLWRYKSEGRGNNYMSSQTRPRIVAPVEDFYEIITRLHRERPPASGQKRAFKLISERYVGIPREVVIYFMRHCPHCEGHARRKSGPPSKRRRLSSGDLDGDSFEAGSSGGPLALDLEESASSAGSDDSSGSGAGTDGLPCTGHRAFIVFLRLLVRKNLDLSQSLAQQPREKLHAIVEACMRQFPPVSEQRVHRRIRTFLKSARRNIRLGKAVPAPCFGELNPEAGTLLLQACRGERAAIIAALANSVEAWPIEPLTEEEVTAVLTTSAVNEETSEQEPEPTGMPNGMADVFSALGANRPQGSGGAQPPDMGVFIRTLMTLSAMSVLPIEPGQLANSFRWVGFLLLMVAQAMENGTGNPGPDSSS